MKINVYSIAKKSNDLYDNISFDLIKMSNKWAKISNNNIFTKEISKQQSTGEKEAKESYTKEFGKHLGNYNIALTPEGEKIDTIEFSKIIDGRSEVNFFIGGAYGFESNFLNSCQKSISLSNLTYSHKVAKVVLFEQLYRVLTLLNNHPYHKI